MNNSGNGKALPFSFLIFLGILNQIGFAEAVSQQPMWLVYLERVFVIAVGFFRECIAGLD